MQQTIGNSEEVRSNFKAAGRIKVLLKQDSEKESEASFIRIRQNNFAKEFFTEDSCMENE